KAGSLGRQPLIERRCDAVEIFEEALAIGLDESAGVRGRVTAHLKDCERINPGLSDVQLNAVAADLNKPWDVAINDAVELRQRLAQAHPGLRLSRTIPQQADETTAGDAFALREAQAGQ